MPASGLVDFVRLVAAREELRQMVSIAKSPEEIVAIAASNGCVISCELLRLQSRQLSAPYWPWAGQGHAWRRSFFGG